MSQEVELLHAGEILKSNGTDGKVVVSLCRIGLEEFKADEPVFINFDGLPVPFFVEDFAQRGASRAIVKLTSCNCLEDAEELKGRKVYVDAAAYGDMEEEDSLADLAGWTLLDGEGRKVGTISDFEDIPGNPCLYVESESGQVMVPLHEDFIIGMDPDSMTLQMDLPEGLI